MPRRRARLTALAASALALAALAAPAASPAVSPPALTHDQAVQLGREAWQYGFPLMDLLRIRREETSVRYSNGRGASPVNVFSNAMAFATAKDRTVVLPNVDTLYSLSHLDLGREPIVLGHPDMGRRFYDFEFVDPWTNVVGYLGSRTTGQRAERLALVWTGARLRQRIPRGIRVLRVRYRRIWVIGRTLSDGSRADVRKANALQRRYTLTPLSRLGRPGRPLPVRPGRETKHPLPKGLAFLDALGVAMRENPPPARDSAILAKLRAVGIGPGLSPSRAGLSPEALAGLVEGVNDESATRQTTMRLRVLREALSRHGWYVAPSNIGRYGTDYSFRADVAVAGIGANTEEEAMYPVAIADSTGKLFNSANRYRMVFKRGQLPPVRSFWSLTMYDISGYLVANPTNRYAVGSSHPPLVRRADGSVVIDIQRTRPTERGVNWLPSPPSGGFRLNLRLYWPTARALSRAWLPPGVERVG